MEGTETSTTPAPPAPPASSPAIVTPPAPPPAPPSSPPSSSSSPTSTVAHDAAAAAGRAVVEAAANAAKKGINTSELGVTLAGIVVAGVLGALEVLKRAGGPLAYLALAMSTALPVIAYQFTRAHVKSSALKAAAAAILASSTAPAPEVDQ